jgi:lysophospholipase L1-like esterase
MFCTRPMVIAAVLSAATLACSDTTTSPQSVVATQRLAAASEGRGAFQRYVAIGTSISMGVASDGTIRASQEQSWPAQLARLAHREITQPYIGGTGCRPPMQAPLSTGIRIDGESAAADPSTLHCSPLEAGIQLPTQNLAINGALVRDALFTTPENITDAGNAGITANVLPPGQTQISALESQDPKIVSVEFGGNEVLGSRSGIAIPGVTLFPVGPWKTLYTQLVDRVAAVSKYGILVGLITDVRNFPAFRRGSELYAQRDVFSAAFNVSVAPDCDGSDNLLFVPVRVPVAVANGLGRRRAGAGPYVLSCAAGPAAFTDYVLTPDEAATVNAQMAEMTAHIRAEAGRLGFAYTELEALYGRSDVKSPFNVVEMMTTATPYGPYISLDGIHPSADGQRILAEAAARALDSQYGFAILEAAVIASR